MFYVILHKFHKKSSHLLYLLNSLPTNPKRNEKFLNIFNSKVLFYFLICFSFCAISLSKGFLDIFIYIYFFSSFLFYVGDFQPCLPEFLNCFCILITLSYALGLFKLFFLCCFLCAFIQFSV